MESINVSGQECEVNEMPKGIYRYEPTHQLIAPQGFRFESVSLHCIPCFGVRDVKNRAKAETLIACPADCDCHND